MYNTQTVIRQCITPGMLVMHQGKPWRAAVNKNGKLHIHRPFEAKQLKDLTVEIVLDYRNQPEVML
ncbi:hypothetical protein [Dryocola clanedunensis]